MLDVDVAIVLFGPEREGSAVHAPLRTRCKRSYENRSGRADSMASPAGAASGIRGRVERQESFAGRKEWAQDLGMNPVHGAVEMYAAFGPKLSRKVLSVLELDDDVTADVEGALEQRLQIRALAGDLRPSDLRFDQVTRIFGERTELYEIDLPAPAPASRRICFARKHRGFEPVLSQASDGARAVAAPPPFHDGPYDQRAGIVAFYPCRVAARRWDGNDACDLFGPWFRIPAEIAPQQGEDARGSADGRPPRRAKGGLSKMYAWRKRAQEGRNVVLVEVWLMDTEKPPHARVDLGR